MRRHRTLIRCISTALVLSFFGCSHIEWRADFIKPTEYARVDPDTPFLKCHTADGHVYVLSSWKFAKDSGVILGTGLRYDQKRNLVDRDKQVIPYEHVVLLETNQPRKVTETERFVVMGILTGASIILSVVCLANPKACFGSCPTFYTVDGDQRTLQAEGFSSAVAPILEKTDVDSMYTARAQPGPFELLMTNDALETHLVRSVRLLLLPKPESGRVFRAGSLYYPTGKLHPPGLCRSARGDCLEQVRRADELEYLSPADDKNLAARETVELTFPRGRGRVGLVIGGRNSLLNTFLFYQTLAYMGMSAGEWLMKLQREGDQAVEMLLDAGGKLGDVEAFVLTRDLGWVRAGAFEEVGPIAREVQLIPLPEDLPDDEVRIRLKLTKGYWKLDYLALGELGAPVVPRTLEIQAVEKNGADDPGALALLANPDRYLITYPGEAYRLIFEIPEGSWELFLESRGYYIEWIRRQWLAEEDPVEAARILTEPDQAYRRLAPLYKKLEGSMEEVFWQSKFGR